MLPNLGKTENFSPTSPRILTFYGPGMFLTHSCCSGIGVLRSRISNEPINERTCTHISPNHPNAQMFKSLKYQTSTLLTSEFVFRLKIHSRNTFCKLQTLADTRVNHTGVLAVSNYLGSSLTAGIFTFVLNSLYGFNYAQINICSHFITLGNLPVERAKDAVCFLQRCGVSLVSSYAVCFLQRGGVSLASSAIIYNIVRVKVTR